MLDPDPFAQFELWFAEAVAAGLVYPEAVALATATRDGRPSVRMVLAKGHDAHGFAFYTNVESRKADELAANPYAALVFYWRPLDRQVRVEGPVERVEPAEAQGYFDTRPVGSRIAAWASPQSRPVASREELERMYARAEEELAGLDDPPLPPHWGGYRVLPEAFEFWHSRPNRLHDRIRYEKVGNGWTQVRLAP